MALVVAAASITLVACNGASSTQGGGNVTAAPTPDLDADVNRFEEVARFGSGRAVAAATTDSITAIVTTIGVNLHRDDTVEEIPTSLAFPITQVSIAPDSRTLVLLSATGAAELWSLDPLRPLATFDSTVAARFTDDGRWVDVIGTESATRASTTDGSISAQSARSTPGPVEAVTWFGPDMRAVIIRGDSTSRPGEIWTGTELVDAGYEPGGIERIVRAVGDPSGDRAVFGVTGGAGATGALVSVDLATGAERWRHDIGNDAVQPYWSVGHDGRALAVVGMQARLYGLDGRLETSWELDGAESVDSVVAYGDMPGYAIARTRGSVVFVDADGQRAGESPSGGTRLVGATPAGPAGGIIAPDANGHLRQWDRNGIVVAEFTEYVGGEINDVTVSPDGTSAAMAASDGNVGIVDLAAASLIEPLPKRFVHPEGNVDTVAFVPDGTAVVSGVSEPNGDSSFDDTLSRWELATGDRSFVVSGIPEAISGCTQFRNTVRLSPDGRTFVSPHHDFTVSLRNVDDGSLIHEFPAHDSIVWDLMISPDGRWLATSSDDWTLRLWDLDSFELIADLDAPPGGYPDIAFTPDSTALLVSDAAGAVSLLDVATGAVSAQFDGEKDATARFSVSPDGRYVAAGADDGLVRIWDLASGDVVQDLEGHAAEVTSVEFTPDGRGLVSGSTDGTTRLWRV